MNIDKYFHEMNNKLNENILASLKMKSTQGTFLVCENKMKANASSLNFSILVPLSCYISYISFLLSLSFCIPPSLSLSLFLTFSLFFIPPPLSLFLSLYFLSLSLSFSRSLSPPPPLSLPPSSLSLSLFLSRSLCFSLQVPRHVWCSMSHRERDCRKCLMPFA